MGVTVVAGLLRFWNLGFQSIWLDEAISAHVSSQPLGDIASLSFSQEHTPPFYYVLLKAWTALFGNSEAGLRSLSAVAGVATLPVIFLLGKRLFSPRVGLLAAALASISPFFFWYSQEARVYSLLALAVGLSAYCLLRALGGGSSLWWFGFSLASLIGFYLHLYALFFLPVAGIAWLLLDRSRRGLLGLVLASGVALALYLPWLAQLTPAGGRFNWRPFLSPISLTQETLYAFASAEAIPESQATPGMLLWAQLALMGLLAGFDRDNRKRLALVAIAATAPLVIGFLGSSVYTPLYVPRYFIGGAVFLVLLAARGLDIIWLKLRSLAILVGVGLLVFSAWVIYLETNNPSKENYRAAASYLKAVVGSDDAVAFSAGYISYGFDYYGFSGALPIPDALWEDEQVAQALTPAVQTSKHIWLIRSHDQFTDPKGVLPQWMDTRFPVATEANPIGFAITAYSTNYRSNALPPETASLGTVFGGALRLAGYQVTNPVLTSWDWTYHPPSSSNWLHLSLYWQPLRPLGASLQPSVRLVDEQGQTWGKQVRRLGELPRFFPSSRWSPGEVIRDEYDIELTPGPPPGRYRIEVGVADGDQWLTEDSGGGQRVAFGEVQIVP